MKLVPKNIVILIVDVTFFIMFLALPCSAGIDIGEIRGPLSLDSIWPPQGEGGPCWSPDGTMIVFSWGDGYTAWDPSLGTPNPDGSYIVTMTADGQAIRGPANPLVNDVGWDNHSPDWSPDGNWIVYVGSRVGPAYIARVNPGDGTIIPIPGTIGGHPKQPKWSPDGTKIAYLGGGWWGSPSYHICVTDPDGSTHEDLTPGITGYGATGLSWSPDGAEIVFTQEGESELFVLDVETKDVTPLPACPSGLAPSGPVWACDGDSILFNASGGIYCYQINTQQTEQLTDGPDHLGDWHPTAGLVFSSERGCTVRWDSNIYIAIAECVRMIEAAIDVDPDTLNLNSKGKWITCYIELPEGYDVGDINIDRTFLEGLLEVQHSDIQDGVLMVKFDMQDLIIYLQSVVGVIPPDDIPLTVIGQLANGTRFEGSDTIRVIDEGGEE